MFVTISSRLYTRLRSLETAQSPLYAHKHSVITRRKLMMFEDLMQALKSNDAKVYVYRPTHRRLDSFLFIITYDSGWQENILSSAGGGN